MNMNQKGFATIVFIVLIAILAGILVYVAFFYQKRSTPTQRLSPTVSISPTSKPSTTPAPEPNQNSVSASLGKQFTLKKNQAATITSTDLEIEITAFYDNSCPEGTQCFWSGEGIGFEYRLHGQTLKGVNLVQAFGYQTTIIATDHQTYATLVVEKIR